MLSQFTQPESESVWSVNLSAPSGIGSVVGPRCEVDGGVIRTL